MLYIQKSNQRKQNLSQGTENIKKLIIFKFQLFEIFDGNFRRKQYLRMILREIFLATWKYTRIKLFIET